MFKKVPHTYTIIGFILILCAVLSWIIPAGEFARETVTVGDVTRTVITENSYHTVDSSPQTWQLFTSFISGFEKQAGIIAFLLIIGGTFQVLNSSGAIHNGIVSFLEQTKKLEQNRLLAKIGVNNLVIVLICILFSLFGALFGMSEETLAFVVLIVPLAISMGYDSLTGLCMVYVSTHIGFTSALLNPFTIGIAQGLSGLPLFSGIEYRLVCWVIFTSVFLIGLLSYAHYIRRHPQKSLTYKLDDYWRNKEKENTALAVARNLRSSIIVYTFIGVGLIIFSFLYPVTHLVIGARTISFFFVPLFTFLFFVIGGITLSRSNQAFVLSLLLFTILFLIIGVMGYGWYIPEIAGIFFALGIFGGYAVGYNNDKMIAEFLTGAKDMLSAALVVALAGGIIQLLQDGKIIDTILYSLASLMEGTSKIVSVGVMYAIQTVINVFIPSGSAKAALTMPIMAPFSDVIGISRQATVMAFQFGDGLTNMITPSSGVLMGALGIARIPYEIWVKWFGKALIFLIILGFILLIPTVTIQLTGF